MAERSREIRTALEPIRRRLRKGLGKYRIESRQLRSLVADRRGAFERCWLITTAGFECWNGGDPVSK